MKQLTRVYCHTASILVPSDPDKWAVRNCGAGRDKRKVNHSGRNDGRTRIRMINDQTKEKDHSFVAS